MECISIPSTTDLHAWSVFPIPSTLVGVSLALKSVSCRQYIYESCLYIHSATLNGAFSLFTFKIIIDRYVLIAIFKIIFLCGPF